MNNFEASFLGQVDYLKAVAIQEQIFQIVKNKKIKAVIGLEHPAVMTLGHRLEVGPTKSGDFYCDLPQVKSSRGGLVTIHSEGQLVIYPILDLREQGWGVKTYVHQLLRTTQKLLAQFGIESFVDEQTVGLYTCRGKIAFCGIQIKNGISMHGISLNVRNDLSLFQQIVACGIKNAPLDRLQNYNVNLTLNELFQRWLALFKAELVSV